MWSCVQEAPEAVDVADTSVGQADAVQARQQRVSVATFNVRAFFDPVCDSRRCGPQSYESQPTQSEFEAKARQLAQGIQSLGADVVLLQEIESETCLLAIRDALGQEYETALLGETNSIASLDVGVISKLPFIESFSYRDTPISLINAPGYTYFVREFLEVHLEVGSERLVVFNAHFRSKSPPDDPEQRLAEAVAANQIITRRIEEYPDALVVFGGDLNDTPGSPTLNAVELGGGLHRVAEELGSDAATYVYRGQGQAIDHLYLAKDAAGFFESGTSQVIRNSPRGLAGSDHGGLVATFGLEMPTE